MSKLTNTDFSRLLNQADKNVLAELTLPKKKRAEGQSSAKERHKQRYLQIVKRQKHKDRLNQEGEGNQLEKSQWRDRAAERRNASGDYVKVAEEYQVLKDRTEEESKFLGGDESHTHLVKGLDYRLLEKVRAEIEKKGGLEKRATASPDERALESPDSRTLFSKSGVDSKSPTTSLLAKKIYHELMEQVHPHHSTFQKKLQRIESVVLRGAHFRGNTKKFIPGNMVYQFDLTNTHRSASDIRVDIDSQSENHHSVPVIVFQSTDEAPRSGSHTINQVVAPIHDRILSDLTVALDSAAQLKRRGKRLGGIHRGDNIGSWSEQQPHFRSSKEERTFPVGGANGDVKKSHDDSDDIFIGAGGYNPSDALKTASDAEKMITGDETDGDGGDGGDGKEAVKEERHRYFAEERSARTKHEDHETDQDQSQDGLLPAGLARKIQAVRKRGGEEAILEGQRTARSINDYDECYPDTGTSWIASDEEEGTNKRKRKGKKGEDNSGDEDNEDRKKKPKLTSRGLKRQSEREWKEIERIIDRQKAGHGGEGLDALEERDSRRQQEESARPRPRHAVDVLL